MPKVLVIHSSVKGPGSSCGKVLEEFLSSSNLKGYDVVHRDVCDGTIPYLDADSLAALFAPPEYHSDGAKERAKLVAELIEELATADVVLLGLSMYNYCISAQLKSWFDHIVIDGRTFGTKDGHQVGLLKDRKTILVTARGGFGARHNFNFFDGYVTVLLNMMGIKDITVISAEGQATEGAETNIKNAVTELKNLKLFG